MVIHTAGPRSLALFFEQDELSEDEACPGQDKIKCVVEIARATFCRQGIQAKYFEIEEYEGEAGTVIFVLAGENVGRLLFSFSSVAKAASAVRALREDPLDSRLTRLDGRYYLLIWEKEPGLDRLEWALSEFGRRENPDELFCAHLEEHGQVLMKTRALSSLKKFW